MSITQKSLNKYLALGFLGLYAFGFSASLGAKTKDYVRIIGDYRATVQQSAKLVLNENRVITTSMSWLGDYDVNVIPLNTVASYVSQNIVYNTPGDSFFIDYNGAYNSFSVGTLPSTSITNRYSYSDVMTQTDIALNDAGYSYNSDNPALFGITWVAYSGVGGSNLYDGYIFGSSYDFISMNDANVSMTFDGFEFRVSSWFESNIPTMRLNWNYNLSVEQDYGYLGSTLISDGSLNVSDKYLKAFNDVQLTSTGTNVTFAFRLLCNYQQSSMYGKGYTQGYNDGKNYVLGNPTEFNLYDYATYLAYGQSKYNEGMQAGANVLSLSGVMNTIFTAPISMFMQIFRSGAFVWTMPTGEVLDLGGLMTFFLTIGIALAIVRLIMKVGGK